MMNWKACLLAGASAVVIAGAAQAREPGYYVGAYVGTGLLEDQDIEFSGSSESSETYDEFDYYTDEGFYGDLGTVVYDDYGDTATFEFDADSDLAGSLLYGYDYENGWRGEIELTGRSNNLGQFNDGRPVDYGDDAVAVGADDYTPTSLDGEGPSDADVKAIAIMANVIRDVEITDKVEVYGGLGLGVARLSLTAEAAIPAGVDSGTVISGVTVDIDDDDTVIAGQAILGAGYKIGERWTADLRYSYLFAPNAEFTGADFDGAYKSHALMVGARYQFGQAGEKPEPTPFPDTPPPPPPALDEGDAMAPVFTDTLPCADTQVVVYFEWDRSELTSEARGAVSDAVSRARECGVETVDVIGHADRSGSASYNVGLSNRRARTVANALRAEGVAAELIATQGLGESQPAVQTPDGVREPLNRRAEVTIRIVQ